MRVLGSSRILMLCFLAFALLLVGAGSASAHTFSASSEISIGYEAGTFSGRVSSSESDCLGGRRVELYEVVEGGEDRLAASTSTDGQGNWSISLTVEDGMFYAVAPATSESAYLHFHECGRADSDTVVIEGGEQVAVLGAHLTPGRDAGSGGPEVLGELLQGDEEAGDGLFGGRLPFTGRELAPFAAAGALLIIIGSVLLVRRRRRPRSAPPPPPAPPSSGGGHNGATVFPPALESPHDMYDSSARRDLTGSSFSHADERTGSYVEPVIDQNAPADLREYLGVIAARKWTVVLITLLVTGAALGYSLRQAPLYMAQSRVVVTPLSAGQVSSQSTATESQLVASEQVAARVGEDLGIAPGGLLSGLGVEAVGDSQVLAVSYTSPDPEFAAQAANSFATSYIEFREEEAMRTLIVERRNADRRIDSVEEDLADVLVRMQAARAANDQALLDELQSEELSLSARLGVLNQQLDDLRSEQSARAGVGEVIERATVPGDPFSPDHTTNALLGLLFGLGLGIAVAFLRRQLNNRFEARTDIERALGAPVLATITRFKVTKAEPYPVVTVERPHESASEAYRGLRTNLQVLMDQKGLRSLLVTSPSAGEGKTVTAVNLGVAFAQSGRRVALVSADLRRPRIERYFHIRSDFEGLSGWLAGAEEAPPLLPSGVPNLDILPSGPAPSNPAELLTSPRLARLVEDLKRDYHIIIFDSAPLLPVADAIGLAYQVDATLMVVHAASSHRSATEHASEKLQRVGARLVGGLLNAYDPSLPYYFHELDNYYVGEYFAAETPARTNGGGRHAAKPRGRRLFSRR